MEEEKNKGENKEEMKDFYVFHTVHWGELYEETS
jgi:hypothetical protein